MKTRICLALALPALLAALPLAAQSRLNGNTFGLFGNDADNFMDPNDYGTVDIPEFFSTIQYDADFQSAYHTTSTTPGKPGGMGEDILSAGYARYFNGTYLGLSFEGNLYEQYWSPGPDAYTIYDSLTALIGTESIGGIIVNVGYEYNKQQPSGVSAGGLILGGGWGKNFPLANGMLLKPEVGLVYSKVDLAGLGSMAAALAGFDYILAGAVGADLELNSGKGAAPTVSLNYTFAYFDVFDSALLNLLSASYSNTYDLNDRFSAGFGFGLDIGFSTIKVSSTLKQSTTVIAPNALAGFTYKFNSPFSVNAGIKASYDLFTLNNTKTGGTSTSNTTIGGFNVQTSAGGSFQPHESLAIDFSYATTPYTADMGNLTLGVRFKK
ncbi:MAG: hypothetical protein LBJ31_04130 [Treponema sp.]|jgi:hypothetical protein|nr:hypothetical protein [Treponema sp.]